jgi:stage V sporulation protein B
VFILKKQNVLRSTVALTLSGIGAKTVDFLFRAYYSKQIGSEGMGILSLCFSMHSIMLTLATGGFGLAVSKLVSERYAQHRFDEVQKTMKVALLSVSILSIVAIVTVVFFSRYIAVEFLKEARCRGSIICISPSVLFMGLSYCIKGYFYASRQIVVPATSEFLEQTIKITAISYLLKKLLPFGIEYGCMAVFLGLSIGEFSSCAYLFLFYASTVRKKHKCLTAKTAVLPSMLKVSVPVMATSLAGSFLRMKEEIVVISSLKRSGLMHGEALSVYGEIHGMVMPLIIFPLSLLSSCFTLIVPEISRAYLMKNKIRLKTLVARIYRFCTAVGVLVFCGFWIFCKDIACIIYNAPQISGYLKTLAIISPFMFIDSVSCGILNGMGKQPRLLALSLLDSLIRLVLIYILMPVWGIKALIFVIILSNIFTFIFTFKSVLKFSEILISFAGRLWRHAFCALVTCLFARLIMVGYLTDYHTVYSVIMSAFVYFLCVVIFGSVKRSDLIWLWQRLF